ncbi:hypothetical protein SDC9_114660 [bioreactor metagenome]|uniref:Glycosyltransferase subfamily 4-like N-terminal domain-containing protein n=1 Tax=bioreactor metagenome TaxID=1076179 RepID=A0A645BQU3_9ZZZZ
MRILINFSPIKKGGGQNVALNFIKSLFEDKNIQNKDDYIFLTVKNSPIHLLLEKYKPTQVIFSPSNPMKRIIYETFYLNSFSLYPTSFDYSVKYF